MMDLTKERLIEKLQHRIAVTASYPNVEEARLDAAIFKIALSALTAVPIGAFHIADQQVGGTTDYIKDGEWPIDNGVIEVYAAPPAPLVPNVKTTSDFVDECGGNWSCAMNMATAWNACRAAMLNGGKS